MPLTATAVVSFSFCVQEGGAITSLVFEPLERFFGGDVGGRGPEGSEGLEDGPVDCVLDGGGVRGPLVRSYLRMLSYSIFISTLRLYSRRVSYFPHYSIPSP